MRLIDTDEAKSFAKECWPSDAIRLPIDAFLDRCPTVDAEPVRHGRWIPMRPYLGFKKCSVCGMIWETESPHCPSCGAKMDEGEQDAAD